MLKYVLQVRHLFSSADPDEREESEDTLLFDLENLMRWNVKYLRRHPDTPKLYESDVQYALPEQLAECKIDARKLLDAKRYLKALGASDDTLDAVIAFLQGIEVFRDIPTILDKKSVDCDNLSSFRAAELQAVNVRALPCITSRKRADGGTTYHALVRWPDGTTEDPSLLLGMGGATRADEKREEQRKNQERKDTLMAAARVMISRGEGDARELGRQIDAMCLVPRGGWKW